MPHTPAALLQGEYVPYEGFSDRAIPVEDWTGLEASRFQDSRHMKVVKVVSHTHWPLLPSPPRNIPGTHFC